MRFSSLLLPPAQVEHQPYPRRPGIHWPHIEDPAAIPWRPTHRIYYLDRAGEPRTADVVWLLNRDVSMTPDLYLRRRTWYGHERAQWEAMATTGWVFTRDREYDGEPHHLLYTPQGRTGLEMERIAEGGF